MGRPRGTRLRERTLADGSVSYYAVLTVAVNRRCNVALGCSRDGVSRTQAVEELRRNEALIELGRWENPRASPARSHTTFVVFASTWYAAKSGELSGRGPEYVRWALEVHLLPFFGDYALEEIDLELIEDYKREKLAEREQIAQRIAGGERVVDQNGRAMRPLSNRTINKTLEVLSSVLRKAAAMRLIPENPMTIQGVKLKAIKPKPRWLMPDEVLDLMDAAERIDRRHRPKTLELASKVKALRDRGMALAQAAATLHVSPSAATYYAAVDPMVREPSPRRAIIATLCLAGPRNEELCCLCWPQIDLLNRRIAVSGTKSSNAERYVKIVDFLLVELRRWHADTTPAPDALVYPTRRNTQRSRNGLVAHVVRPAVVEANRVRCERGRPPIAAELTPHSLRHTWISLMLAYGRPIKAVQVQAGHADAKTTLQIYNHVIDTDYGPTASILERLMTYESSQTGQLRLAA